MPGADMHACMTCHVAQISLAAQGSLVRAVRRVEEVLRQATAGAQVRVPSGEFSWKPIWLPFLFVSRSLEAKIVGRSYLGLSCS